MVLATTRRSIKIVAMTIRLMTALEIAAFWDLERSTPFGVGPKTPLFDISTADLIENRCERKQIESGQSIPAHCILGRRHGKQTLISQSSKAVLHFFLP
jgi:hypothetical protein